MARRKARIPQGKKVQPAVTTLTFDIPDNGDFTLDLSQVCSLVNRRFYRQGLEWAVAGFTLFTGTGTTGSFTIDKIPTTWVASNAWVKGMNTWMKMNNEALDDVESIRPKFLDFKVYMDETHHSDGSVNNLIPIDANGNAYATGEWKYSEMVIPLTGPSASTPGDVTTRDIIWTGANYPGTSAATGNNAVSLIEGYAASRGLPDVLDPNAPDDAGDIDGGTPENWIGATQNEGTSQHDDVVETMLIDNNQAPYPYENDGVYTDTMYPGGANQAPGLEPHDLAYVTPTTVGGKTHLRGGTFPGGLIRFKQSFAGEFTSVVQVHLVPGGHRGYMARAMQDV